MKSEGQAETTDCRLRSFGKRDVCDLDRAGRDDGTNVGDVVKASDPSITGDVRASRTIRLALPKYKPRAHLKGLRARKARPPPYPNGAKAAFGQGGASRRWTRQSRSHRRASHRAAALAQRIRAANHQRRQRQRLHAARQRLKRR
eukprot:1629948-Pleurochrysis_carterae.AAC.3